MLCRVCSAARAARDQEERREFPRALAGSAATLQGQLCGGRLDAFRASPSHAHIGPNVRPEMRMGLVAYELNWVCHQLFRFYTGFVKARVEFT